MRRRRWASSAAASVNHHFMVGLQHHISVLIEQQDGFGGEPDSHAAGRGNMFGLGRVHQELDDGVVGGVVRVRQWEVVTRPVAQAGMVAPRRYNPFIPTDVREIHVEWTQLAGEAQVGVQHRVALAVASGQLRARLEREAAHPLPLPPPSSAPFPLSPPTPPFALLRILVIGEELRLSATPLYSGGRWCWSGAADTTRGRPHIDVERRHPHRQGAVAVPTPSRTTCPPHQRRGHVEVAPCGRGDGEAA